MWGIASPFLLIQGWASQKMAPLLAELIDECLQMGPLDHLLPRYTFCDSPASTSLVCCRFHSMVLPRTPLLKLPTRVVCMSGAVTHKGPSCELDSSNAERCQVIPIALRFCTNDDKVNSAGSSWTAKQHYQSDDVKGHFELVARLDTLFSTPMQTRPYMI